MYLTGSPVPVVSVVDTALDLGKMGADLKTYVETRDPELISEKQGKTATRFYCARIRASVFEDYVQQAPTEKDAYIRAFSAGITKITGLVDMTGVSHVAVEPEDKMMVGGTEVKRFARHQLDLIYPGIKQEIGSVIWSMSFLPPGESSYSPPPPSLLRVLANRISRDAAETRSDAPATSSAKPRGAERPASVQAGAAGGGATAKGRSKSRSKKTGTRSKSRRSSKG